MGTSGTATPERPTLVERFVDSLGLPYFFSCIVIVTLFALAGPLLGNYVDTLDFGGAVRSIFSIHDLTGWQGIVYFVLNSFLSNLYALYMIRYMRLRVVGAEKELSSISPFGEETLHEAFGNISRYAPSLLLSAGIFLIFAILSVPSNNGPTGIAGEISDLVNSVFGVVIFGTFAWIYLSTLRGLHQLGNQSIRLNRPSKDPTMGVRSIGSISLSLAFAFFSLLGIYAVTSFIVPFDVAGTLVFLGFLVVGIVMFFLPLLRIHGRMLAEKTHELSSIRNQIVDVLEKHSVARPEEESSTLAKIERLLALQTIDQKIANVSTWPFDTSILSRFVVILLSVTAILLSRFITNALGV